MAVSEIIQGLFLQNFSGISIGPKPIRSPCVELFRQPLREQINLKHLLVRLADLIEWDRIDAVCISHFKIERGRRATSPYLIAGLLYLQQAFDLSDENVVSGWVFLNI